MPARAGRVTASRSAGERADPAGEAAVGGVAAGKGEGRQGEPEQ